jgi:hypothetical protein
MPRWAYRKGQAGYQGKMPLRFIAMSNGFNPAHL